VQLLQRQAVGLAICDIDIDDRGLHSKKALSLAPEGVVKQPMEMEGRGA
jgi:hypothetical protein